MSRKELFANLNAPAATAQSPDLETAPRVARQRVRPILGAAELIDDASASPVGAVGQSLSAVAERARRADDIEQRLAQGSTVVELDPSIVDPSFLSDRMPSSPETHASLVEAVRENGQQVPILVRPRPDAPGRYQVAYGHRRLRAAIDLGRPVRAVVRTLSDEELVVAQGQENNERRDLSYIEKARFAHSLDRSFGRNTAMKSMGVYKSDLSNMLSVVNRIPGPLIELIGPAAGTGRRGWIALAERIAKGSAGAAAMKVSEEAGFADLPSDARFKVVLAATQPPRDDDHIGWVDKKGVKIAHIKATKTSIQMTIDRRKSPELAAFVLDRLHDLYRDFEAKPRK